MYKQSIFTVIEPVGSLTRHKQSPGACTHHWATTHTHTKQNSGRQLEGVEWSRAWSCKVTRDDKNTQSEIDGEQDSERE